MTNKKKGTEIPKREMWKGGTLKFLGCDCVLIKDGYREGGVALELEIVGTGEPMARASVWVKNLADGEIAIKNYSENEGMLKVLVDAGIVTEPHRMVASGFVTIPVCKLLWI